MRIFKYVLSIETEQVIYAPEWRALHVDAQDDQLALWVEVSGDHSAQSVAHHIRIYGTGHDHIKDPIPTRYVGTAQMPNGLVWHVYEESRNVVPDEIFDPAFQRIQVANADEPEKLMTAVAILERIKEKELTTTFGFEKEVLLAALSYEDAKPYLKEEVAQEQWHGMSVEEVTKEAVDYLEFAFGKARDHRGLSAGRSVEKMGEWLWLLKLNVDLFDEAGYVMYGVPKLMVAADELGVARPQDVDLVNMGAGYECQPDCEEGCL